VIIEPVLPIVAGFVTMSLPVLADVVAALLPVLANLIPVPCRQLVRPAFSRQSIVQGLPPLLGGAVRGKLTDARPLIA
jgi:hypothetical protein